MQSISRSIDRSLRIINLIMCNYGICGSMSSSVSISVCLVGVSVRLVGIIMSLSISSLGIIVSMLQV